MMPLFAGKQGASKGALFFGGNHCRYHRIKRLCPFYDGFEMGVVIEDQFPVRAGH